MREEEKLDDDEVMRRSAEIAANSVQMKNSFYNKKEEPFVKDQTIDESNLTVEQKLLM